MNETRTITLDEVEWMTLDLLAAGLAEECGQDDPSLAGLLRGLATGRYTLSAQALPPEQREHSRFIPFEDPAPLPPEVKAWLRKQLPPALARLLDDPPAVGE